MRRAIETLAELKLHRWIAVAFGSTTAILIEGGVVDGLRAADDIGTWQLDEILFVAIAALVGILVTCGISGRRFRTDTDRRVEGEKAAQVLALHDPLTGLLNRRGLEEIAGRQLPADATRVLILADLDDFKWVNDTHGHASGDDVLRQFAQRLGDLGCTGTFVHAARLGGDEFVVVADIRADDSGDELGDRIVADIAIGVADGGRVSIGVSAGLTQWSPELSLEGALEQADIAMYEAKRIGAGLRRFDRMGDGSLPHSPQARRLFERHLAALPDNDGEFCVAAISIDRFHSSKRAFGYGFAARLFRATRERLEVHRSVMLIERICPDTMGILFRADDMHQALAVVDTLNTLSSAAYALDGQTIEAPLTIGLAGPAPVGQLRETVEQAQLALDEAQRSGQRQIIFDLRKQHHAAQNRLLMDQLRDAIATDRLEVHYQPKLSARTGGIDSFEALARWSHPVRGSVSPGEFIPLAEDSGDIDALTFWVLDRALADWTKLETAGVVRPIYVNVSAQLVGDAGFSNRLLELLNGKQDRIGIEITETAVLDNPERALAHLRMLAEAGISIAIDDYGVGLSSLSYLKRLPATELKIDMMFITDLAESHRDPMIVRSTIDLAHGLGLRVTAEGVDKPEALALLKIMGCDMIQGYEISPALPLAGLIDFMRNHDNTAENVPDCATQFLALVNAQ